MVNSEREYAPTSLERQRAPEVKRMAAGQMKTGPITHSMHGGAFKLNSVPTSLRRPNAGERMIAKKLNVAGKYAGVVRRRSAAANVSVNRTPRTGYPAINKAGMPAKMNPFKRAGGVGGGMSGVGNPY